MGALENKILTQRYTPTVAISRSNVQAANPSSIDIGMDMAAVLAPGTIAISRKTGQPTRVGYPCRSAMDDRRQRRLDPRQLCRRCHAAQQPAEVWVLDALNDVLPAIGSQHAGLDLRRLCNA